MSAVHQLQCIAPGQPPRFAMSCKPMPEPGRGQVVVRVEASSVNPIDAKRAAGYGRRLLGLKGAARFPLVLGNDLAGVVQSVGPSVTSWRPGDRVYGLVPTAAHKGAHASHVLVQANDLRASPKQWTSDALAALPYTFTTLCLALEGVGLNQHNAQGKAVLVYGASGGLGQLALQVLVKWGARVTAVCSTAHVRLCLDLGAAEVLDRTCQSLSSLPSRFDATLNFAQWADEATLIGFLKPGALGHATTVHPLLGSFDEFGWILGGWRAYQAWSAMRSLISQKGSTTRYRWVVFQPNTSALDALQDHLSNGGQPLPIGLTVPLEEGDKAFAHVTQQCAGRAIVKPV